MHNIRNIAANALIIVLKKEQVNRYLCLTSSIVFREIWIFINASNPLLHFNSSTNIKKKKKIESFFRYCFYPSFPSSLSTETSYIVLYHSGRGKKRVHFWKITSLRRTAACIIAGGCSTRKRDPPSEIAKTAGNSSESGEHQMHPVEYSYVRHRGALFMTRPSSTDHAALARIKSCSFDF